MPKKLSAQSRTVAVTLTVAAIVLNLWAWRASSLFDTAALAPDEVAPCHNLRRHSVMASKYETGC